MRTLRDEALSLDRIKSRCRVDGDCWHWRGHCDKGRPTLFLRRENGRRKSRPTRQVVWEAKFGRRFPAGHVASVTCDSETCCSPQCVAAVLKESVILRLHAGKKRRADIVAKATLSRRAHAKLNWDKVRQIRERVAAGEQGKTLALEMGVSRATISAVVLRQVWREATPWMMPNARLSGDQQP